MPPLLHAVCGRDSLVTNCALVGSSLFNERDFLMRSTAGAFDLVIAVDGGYAHLEKIGVVPDLAIGDFDSLGYVPGNCPVERFDARKDESDMALALRRACELGATCLRAYGALGLRLDHTLANLQLFSLFSERGIQVQAVGEDELAVFLAGPATLEVSARSAGIVSVFSLSDACTGVTERGLAYGLENAVLTNRTSLGLSNELAGTPATIGVESGTLVVFLPVEAGEGVYFR